MRKPDGSPLKKVLLTLVFAFLMVGGFSGLSAVGSESEPTPAPAMKQSFNTVAPGDERQRDAQVLPPASLTTFDPSLTTFDPSLTTFDPSLTTFDPTLTSIIPSLTTATIDPTLTTATIDPTLTSITPSLTTATIDPTTTATIDPTTTTTGVTTTGVPTTTGVTVTTGLPTTTGTVVPDKLGPVLSALTRTSTLSGKGVATFALRFNEDTTGVGKLVALVTTSAKKKAVTLGSKKFAAKAGKKLKLRVALNRRGRKLMKNRRSLRVRLVLATKDKSGNKRNITRSVKLKRPRR